MTTAVPPGQPSIHVMPLGAGQDVGRSCVVVGMSGRTVMFDCGMHVGYRDERRFPDFKLLSAAGRYRDIITCVIITHFHLDHCGALPYFSEVLGYDGPIYATYPTKVLMPIMLEDYHRVMAERQDGKVWYTRQHIYACMSKVVAVDLGQRVQVEPGLDFTTYYAGHVLGAAMFHVACGGQTVLYTGDYNTAPERHLGPARVERVVPDVLISESTYATTLRDSRRARERDFLQAVHDCVSGGGKVLIPVFAVGRAQELLLLVEEFWERLGLKVPIYFSGGMAARANLYYRLLINWTNDQVRSPESRATAFNFPLTQPWDRAHLHDQGACVLFATPGMLHGGASLEAFKAWAGSERNLVILPGYQVGGTLGSRLANTTAGQHLQVDKSTVMEIRCQVRYLSFSAHADAKGILQLVRQCGPPHSVVLVHGERSRMEFMRDKIRRTFNIPCWTPIVGNLLNIRTPVAHHPAPLGRPPAPCTQSSVGPSTTVAVRISEQLLCLAMQDMAVGGAAKRGRAAKVARDLSWAAQPSGPLFKGLPLPFTSIPVTGVLIGRKVSSGAGTAEQHGSNGKQQPLWQQGQLQQVVKPQVQGQGQQQQQQTSTQGQEQPGQTSHKVQQQQQHSLLWTQQAPAPSFVVGQAPVGSPGGKAAQQQQQQQRQQHRRKGKGQQQQQPGARSGGGEQGAEALAEASQPPPSPLQDASLLSCREAQGVLRLPAFTVMLQCTVPLSQRLVSEAEAAVAAAHVDRRWHLGLGVNSMTDHSSSEGRPGKRAKSGQGRSVQPGAADGDAGMGASADGSQPPTAIAEASAAAALSVAAAVVSTSPNEPIAGANVEQQAQAHGPDWSEASRVLTALHFLLSEVLGLSGPRVVAQHTQHAAAAVQSVLPARQAGGKLMVRSFTAELHWEGDTSGCSAGFGSDLGLQMKGSEAGLQGATPGQAIASPVSKAPGAQSDNASDCEEGEVSAGDMEDMAGWLMSSHEHEVVHNNNGAARQQASGWVVHCSWASEDAAVAELLLKALSV